MTASPDEVRSVAGQFPGSTDRPTVPGEVPAVALRRIYQDVLGAEHVGEDDGFFVLGGSSLLVELLAERVTAELGVRVSVADFYAEPTLAGLRRLVGGGAGAYLPERPLELAEWLAGAAEPDPGRAAVAGPDGRLSYGELVDLVSDAAAGRAAAPPEPRVLRLPSTVAGVRTLLTELARRTPLLLLDPAAPEAEAERAAELFRGEFAPGSPWAGRDALLAVATSGSTGRPKVVVCPTDGVLLNRLRQAEDFGIRPDDVYLVTPPLSFLFGLGAGLFAGLLGGATVVLPPRPLSPDTLAACAEQHRITLIVGVGTAYRFLLATGTPLPGLRRALTGGEPLLPDLASTWAERAGVPVTDSYGVSEAGHLSHDLQGVPGSVGPPLPGVELRLLDGDGVPAATGKGEILARSSAMTLGYAGDPELTAARLRNGWFHTGDLGEIGADGRLFIRGRLDDQINLGGAKVDPREVEAACRELLDVSDCAVVGLPLPSGRTEVCAYVVADRPVTRADLVRALGDRLSAHKIPTRVVQLPALPRGANGKLARGELPR